MRVCTTMLKQGVAEGLSLHDIAGLMIRSDDGAASPLERLVASATVSPRACRRRRPLPRAF
jgi:hypothetical protein